MLGNGVGSAFEKNRINTHISAPILYRGLVKYMELVLHSIDLFERDFKLIKIFVGIFKFYLNNFFKGFLRVVT